jgi:cell wall-associated NlpC family hydrolase
MAGGRRTSNPQPGDMVFYRSPEHVGIYIGDGKVIEMGGTPGPLKLPVTYRSDRIGYWTFDLSDA